MNIKELRENNLVLIGANETNIFKVINTFNNLVIIDTSYDIYGLERSFNIDANNVKPVVITNKLLQQINFVKNKDGNHDYYFSIELSKYVIMLHYDQYTSKYSLCIYNDNDYIVLKTDVVYFHKLQNIIFDTINIELNIDNIIKPLNH